MTDQRVIEALDLLRQAMGGFPVTQDGYDQWTRARDLIAALRAEQAAPVPATPPPVPPPLTTLPTLPDGVRPLVFDGHYHAAIDKRGAFDAVPIDGRSAMAREDRAEVAVRTGSRAESEATARVMHAAAEWHARGYDLVPVRRRNDHA